MEKTQVTTEEDFKNHVASLREKRGYKDPKAFSIGIRKSREGIPLEVTYPVANFNENFSTAVLLYSILGLDKSINGTHTISIKKLTELFALYSPFHDTIETHQNIQIIKSFIDMEVSENLYCNVDFVVTFLWDTEQSVESCEEGYLKLQLLSQRKVKPHEVNLEGAFGKLTNVAWTNYGPILPKDVQIESLRYIASAQPLSVSHVDKFPYLLNYYIPSGVRVAAGHKVRLGAHLAEGTTVMQAGFVNFNAGTLGNAMVEGRISAGVVVGKDSDVGGGASIMGTLSGGNNTVLSIGENCLLGANAGAGISLGNGSTIAAGLYVTAGTKVALYDLDSNMVDIDGKRTDTQGENIVKAYQLSEKENLLFYQDSSTGQVICKPNKKSIELNKALHLND